MAGRNYPRLDIVTFGNHLLTTKDLDPVYVALRVLIGQDQWSFETVARWLVAYWCFYHCGVASYLSQSDDPAEFWDLMEVAARNAVPVPGLDIRWPRGSERRHFRGESSVQAVKELRARYERPEEMVLYIAAGAPSYEEVARRAQEHRLFGPWISFKVCDMVDRVLLQPIDFSQAAVFMFKDPVKAALMLWRQHHGFDSNVKPKDETLVINEVVAYLREKFSHHLAPPMNDRPVDLQEVETVLCKWKSHMNGHYPLDNDIDEILDGLGLWTSHSPHALNFFHAMPKGAS